MTFERRIGRRKGKNKNVMGKAFAQEIKFQLCFGGLGFSLVDKRVELLFQTE